MASDLRVQRILPPYLGLDTDSAPELVAPEKAVAHQNWLLDRAGKCVMRGPLLRSTVLSSHQPTASRPLLGHFAYNDRVLWQYCTVDPGGAAAGYVAPWESFWKKATTDNQLLQFDNAQTLDNVSDFLAGTSTNIGGIATVPAAGWGNGTRLGGWVYMPSIESGVAGVDTGLGYLRKETVLTSWDGTLVAGGIGPWGVAATQPTYTIAARAHYQRVFICAAKDPVNAAGNAINYDASYNPHQIYWTNPTVSGALAGAYTDWRNPNTLAINKLTVGQQDGNDATVALAKVERNLMIFKRRSAYVLYGSSEDTWSVRQVSTNLGCIDPRSVVEYEDGVYFMSDRGFFRYDGAQFTEVTKNLRSTVLRYARQRCGNSGTVGGFVKANIMPNGYIHLSIGVQSYTTGAVVLDWDGYYYPPTDSWSNLAVDTTVMSEAAPFGCVTTSNYFIPYSPSDHWQANDIFAPENVASGSYGTDQHPTALGTTAPTAPTFRTRLYNFVSPLWSAQLQRYLMDYNYQLVTGVDGAEGAFSIALVNGAGETLQALTAVPAAGANSASAYRRRAVLDVFSMLNNAADLALIVGRSGTNPVTRAEVFAIDVQYQAAQERRGQ